MSSVRDMDEDAPKQQTDMNTCLATTSNDSQQGGENKHETVSDKIKPPIPAKPGTYKPVKPPPIKRKPLTKSQSVDSYAKNKTAEVDLTQVGDSEWKDFVLKRRESGDEEELTPAIRSLNLHRQSLGGSEQTIIEDQVLKHVQMNQLTDTTESGMSEFVDTKAVNQDVEYAILSKPADAECKKTDVFNDNTVPNAPEENVTDINGDIPSGVVNGECNDVSESNVVSGVDIEKDKTKKTEEASAPTAITLPKPRQIMSEIKRNQFGTSRSMSLPATHLAPQIKRSSDILREASAQTPYFCRLSRGSVDLLEAPGLSNLSMKEESKNSANDTPEN